VVAFRERRHEEPPRIRAMARLLALALAFLPSMRQTGEVHLLERRVCAPRRNRFRRCARARGGSRIGGPANFVLYRLQSRRLRRGGGPLISIAAGCL
jgi:hypothetical protein